MNTTQQAIHITDNACEKIHTLISGEKTHDDESLFLRISIVGNGCSGFSYDFEFCDEIEEDDLQVSHSWNNEQIVIVVDPISIQALEGAKLDYITDMTGERFTISNPHAKSVCGCGNSFSLDQE